MPVINCSVCGKLCEPSTVVTEVQLEVNSKYIQPDEVLADMNGLWRKTKEFLCESCFKDYVAILTEFYDKHKK